MNVIEFRRSKNGVEIVRHSRLDIDFDRPRVGCAASNARALVIAERDAKQLVAGRHGIFESIELSAGGDVVRALKSGKRAQGLIPLVNPRRYQSLATLENGMRTVLDKVPADGLGNLYFFTIEDGAFARICRALDEEAASENPDRRCTAFLGNSPIASKLRKQIMQYGRTPYPVLILGERGTGKEIVARAVHHASAHSRQTPVIVNCGTISKTVETATSALFGHVKWAFTGAVADRDGYWKLADGSTLFLDEVADLPLEVQGLLLRAVEHGTFERLGNATVHHADVRLIAATNKDLAAEIGKGTFRADFLDRINVLEIHTPPLRDHVEDIGVIARAFWRDLRSERGALSPAALRALAEYPWPKSGRIWPGNVRTLETILKRLDVSYPKRVPSAADVRTVLEAREDPAAIPQGDSWPEVFRARCGEHLTRAGDELRACKTSLREFTRDKRRDAQAIAAVLGKLRERHAHLDRLYDTPYLFFDERARLAVYRFKGSLEKYLAVLANQDAGEPPGWKEALKPRLEKADSLVQKTLKELTMSGSGRAE